MPKSFNLLRNRCLRAAAVVLAGGASSHCSMPPTSAPPAVEPTAEVSPVAAAVVPPPAPAPDLVLAIGSQAPATPAPPAAPVGPVDLLTLLKTEMVLPKADQPAVARELAWYVSHPDYLNRVFERARRYMPHIVASLRERDMPLDLALLPVVESAYDPFAYSHGRAAGLWQIIPGTARRLGVTQNWWFDGRRDVLQSTRAALDYLELLHDQFDGDWLLAVAGYNSGEGHVARAVKANRQRNQGIDFWSLSARLPKETRAYVPRLLALRWLVEEADALGLNLPAVPDEPQFTVVETGGQLDMALAAELINEPADVVYAFNPGVNRWATAPEGPHRLLIPAEHAADFAQALQELGPRERVKWTRHKVRSGETLGHLARRYHTTPAVLREVNSLSGNTIRAGDYLMIPHAVESMASYTQSADARARRTQDTQRRGTRTVHVVQSGESFWSIAQRYDVGVRELAAWNAMAPRDTLSVGRKLVVWQQGAVPQDTARIRRLTYVVRRGDSLAGISSRFRVSVSEVVKWNKISTEAYLQPGQRLVLYVDVTKQSS
jgi:membrane-bound lytic murein transglycosylase D